MDFEKYKHYTSEEFLRDEEFRLWVLKNNENRDANWKEFLKVHPHIKMEVNEARRLLLALQAVEPEISRKVLDDIWAKVQINYNPVRTVYVTIIKVAAIILFVISLGTLIFYGLDDSVRFPSELVHQDAGEKGKIILPDGAVKEFDAEMSNINQHRGILTVNNDTVKKEVYSDANETQRMNQLIIPYGKRSEIRLADGTLIKLNSGSRLIFPDKFDADKREVFLYGEAYFDVGKDASRPFYVITEKLKIRVLGTKFDVSAYPDDGFVQAVLISGKIQAGKNKMLSRPVEMEPGERMIYTSDDDQLIKDKVDVNLYTSWIYGYLVFEEEPLNGIFKKLERFYNTSIQSEPDLHRLFYSGKLDLAEDINTVFNNISFSSPINVTTNNSGYMVRLRR